MCSLHFHGLFLGLIESTCETRGKKVFYFTLKLCSFSRKSKFRILDIQISWSHQTKHKTRNTFYWITWEVNKCRITKILSKKIIKTCNLATSSRLLCICKELSTNSIGKLNFSCKLLMWLCCLLRWPSG